MKYLDFLKDRNPRCVMKIKDLGEITLELFPDVAPITVANFLKLVENKFYNGIVFHRVIAGFMIQAGDPTGTGIGGSKDKIVGEFLSNGFKNLLEHTRGVISMARTSNPNSAGSQFFIMHQDASYLDGEYAGFGVVVSGMEVVDAIANSKTIHDRPIKDIMIEEIVRIR